MGNSGSILAYPDVKQAFDRAMLGKGIKVTLNNENDAAHFMGRCNSFRVLDRRENSRLYESTHSLFGRSVYDLLKISRDGVVVRIEPITLDALSVEEL